MFQAQIVTPSIGWNFAPSILAMLVSQAALYGYLIILARKDGHWGKEVRGRHVAFFAIGLSIIFIALVSPLDALSNAALFSAHMTQHLLLLLLAPAFLLLGTPGYWIHYLYGLPVLKRILPIITHPVVTLLAFNFIMWVWHLPIFYQAALNDANVHVLEHMSFLGAGVLMWLPVIHDAPPQHTLSYPARIIYLFANMISSSLLGAVFSFTPSIAYSFYGNAPLAFGTTPATDQALAGLLMWIPGGGVFFTAILLVFSAWLNSEDRKAKTQYPPPPYVQ